MNWLYRFVIYLFVNAARITLNDSMMDSSSDYRDNLSAVNEALEMTYVPQTSDSGLTLYNTISFYDNTRVSGENGFIDYLLKELRRLMHQITDLPEKHRARLRFSSD
ncbi:MAG TPA: hypothetical protein DEO38_02400 [Bacteroidales bacterium]|nr:hypothetical protein [Bacteroidales bacterium]